MVVQGSLRLNQDGITVLTNSYNPYSFSSEGMSKSNGQHYKVGAGLVCSHGLSPYLYTASQISDRDIRIVKRLGAGASSTVSFFLQHANVAVLAMLFVIDVSPFFCRCSKGSCIARTDLWL